MRYETHSAILLDRCTYTTYGYYMNTNTTTQATSTYGTVLEVTISKAGIVTTTSGVLVGDVDGMTRLGWEFSA